MGSKYLFQRTILKFALTLGCCLLIASPVPVGVPVTAQSSSCPDGAPQRALPRHAWPQNALVSVNVDSNSFTREQFDNCINPVFQNYNLANGATLAGHGNFSGVRFSVTFSPTSTATVSGDGNATNAPGVSYGYQVNRSNQGLNNPAVEYGGTAPVFTSLTGNRNSAVTNINTGITSCAALQRVLAHEIGHTLGLEECVGCGATASVMVEGVCTATNQDGDCTQADLNQTSRGLTGPSICDNTVIQQAGGYNPNTMSQPSAPSGGGGGGGGGTCTSSGPTTCLGVWPNCSC